MPAVIASRREQELNVRVKNPTGLPTPATKKVSSRQFSSALR
jgi:hypothetical protein